MKRLSLSLLFLFLAELLPAQTLINTMFFNYRNNQWELSARNDYHFDQQGRDSVQEYWQWRAGAFQANQRTRRHYNANGEMDTLVRARWDGQAYYDQFRESHFYTGSRLDSTIDEMRTTANFYNNNRYSYTYNSGQQELSRLHSAYSGAWEQRGLDSSYYNAAGQLQVRRSFLIDTATANWNPRSEHHYQYDAGGRLSQVTNFRMTPLGYDTNSINLYIYDSFGLLLEERLILTLNGFDPTTRTRYLYLPNGDFDTLYYESLMWNTTNTWNSSLKVAYTYSNSPGVSLAEEDLEIQIYPNPSSSLVFLDQLPSGPKHISIISNEGRLVRSWKSGQNRECLDISAWRPGLYFIRIETQLGLWLRPFIKS